MQWIEFIFLTQLAIGIVLFILLQKINRIKKQIDDITKEVENYVAFVTSEDVEERKGQVVSTEEQNRLIQAVLGEYFP